MKRIFVLVLTTFILLGILCSCNVKTDKNADNGKLNVVTTIFPYYDFAKNIAGDKVNIELLLSPGSEPHHFEPTPSQIVSIENCDLFIYTGGENDKWAQSIVDSLDSDIKVLKLIDCVETYKEEEIDKTQKDTIDEHIWTSPKNAIDISKAISKEIQTIDKENIDYYKSNEESYIEKLSSLDNKFKEIVSNGNRDKIVFGDRFPVLYFTKQYNLDYECAFPGCSHETEPSISTVNRLIDIVKDEKIPVVFYLDFSNQSVANLLCEDTGAKSMVYHSCHNVSADDFEKGVSYISLMEENADALKEALK